MFFRPADATCNVCGGSSFAHGPGGRAAPTGAWPRCTACGSLERHRALRRLMEQLPAAALSWRRGLQFSPDVAMRPEWFRTYEVSVYGGPGSLDLNRIERPAAVYDFITLNMILEFIPDAKTGFRELVRILSVAGILQICFSEPQSRERTLDYDRPQGDYDKGQGYFHLFGRDLAAYFGLEALGAGCLVLNETDPVTGVTTDFHFFSKDRSALAALADTIAQVRQLLRAEPASAEPANARSLRSSA